MSKEGARRFFESIRDDEALADRLLAVAGDLREVSRLAGELRNMRGFEIDESAVLAALDSLGGSGPAELTDEQLTAASGGLQPAAPSPLPIPYPTNSTTPAGDPRASRPGNHKPGKLG